MATDITYITVDSTHRIEVMPSGNHYPQRLINPEFLPQGEAWGYYKTGNKQKHFTTESGAQRFLAKQGQDCIIPEPITEQAQPTTEDITPEQLAEIMPFAQEYSEHKQMERATFAAESALETVPSYEQERRVVRVERRSEFSMCGTSFFYYHPECYKMQGTTPIEINELSHREVGSRAVCAECGESVHKAPDQAQQQEADNQPQAYRHTFDQQCWFYYHKVCVEHNPPEVHFDLIPLGEVPQEAECDFCYKPVHGASAYYAIQEQEKEVKPKTKRKKGRPSQDKMIRHYTIDREVAEFIDKLPDGERSRFVNSLLRQGVESAKKKEQ